MVEEEEETFRWKIDDVSEFFCSLLSRQHQDAKQLQHCSWFSPVCACVRVCVYLCMYVHVCVFVCLGMCVCVCTRYVWGARITECKCVVHERWLCLSHDVMARSGGSLQLWVNEWVSRQSMWLVFTVADWSVITLDLKQTTGGEVLLITLSSPGQKYVDTKQFDCPLRCSAAALLLSVLLACVLVSLV